ncbi:MAG: type II toxin-antitoxin system YafQ family toxin [Kiritimatiellaeota bacterium]|nr:type II toxin-antitoxin system YafQ family toxin [Kiritimatiellota bacterium]
MPLLIVVESGFKSDWKHLQKKRYPYDEMEAVIKLLEYQQPLPGRYKDHQLSGNWKGFRECHIKSNWLLIYRIVESSLVLVRTGTHDDLFK